MKKTKSISLMGIFVALMVAGAYIQITLPTPFMPMHITMQLFVAVVCGMLLPVKMAFMVEAVYIFAGVMGLPIFASGGGLYYIAKPTFGFIIGFLLCAVTCSYLKKKYNPESIKGYFIIGLIGMMMYYIAGNVYYIIMSHLILMTNVPLPIIFFNCFVVSIVPDVMITFFASITARRLKNVTKIS